MSRRRTTQKLHASLKEETPISTASQAVDAEPGKDGASDASQHDMPFEAELGPWLAAEAARRAASETRSAETLARYFKATVAILCLNMVVGGANVAVSFMNAGETRTVVVAPPAPMGSQTTPAPAASTPSAEASPQATAPVTTPPPSAIPLLGKEPLLGKPDRPEARPSRPPAVTRPARSRPPAAEEEVVEEEPAPKPSHLAAERW